MGDKKDSGAIIREWLTEKMGNPIMPSKEKDQIDELDAVDKKERDRQKALQDLQERGEDYSAGVHRL
jgi:hypothetical protein